MESIDRLREYVRGNCATENERAILRIADAIEQEVKDELKAKDGQMWLRGYGECHAQLMEGNEVIAEDLEKAGWVKLPVDAEGAPIHVGDVMEVGNGRRDEVRFLTLNGYGWSFNDKGWVPSWSHHRAQTVEDVLREFADEVQRCCDTEDTIDEYAAKLRLAEED